MIKVLILAVLLVGCSDYEEEQKAEMHYCGMVAMEYWPPFDSKINCENVTVMTYER